MRSAMSAQVHSEEGIIVKNKKILWAVIIVVVIIAVVVGVVVFK